MKRGPYEVVTSFPLNLDSGPNYIELEDTPLPYAVKHWYYVTVKKEGWKETVVASPVMEITPDGSPHQPPASPSLNISDVPDDNGWSISLNWAHPTPTEVIQYYIYRSPIQHAKPLQVMLEIYDSTSSTSYIDTMAIPGYPYIYKVVAFDGITGSKPATK